MKRESVDSNIDQPHAVRVVCEVEHDDLLAGLDRLAFVLRSHVVERPGDTPVWRITGVVAEAVAIRGDHRSDRGAAPDHFEWDWFHGIRVCDGHEHEVAGPDDDPTALDICRPSGVRNTTIL